MNEPQRHEVIVRRGRSGPGCIGIFLIFGVIALVAEDIGNHPGIWIGGALAVAALAAVYFYFIHDSTPPAPPAPTTKKCPDCAEIIQADARICRYCGYRADVPPST